MSQKITIHAKSVEQGLAQAAKQLKAPVAKLEYEILQEKKSFMGKSKSVSLAVWLQETQQSDTSMEKVSDPAEKTEDLDGYISIEEGKALVTDPKPGGLKPVIIPTSTVKVSINDEVIETPTEVSSEDKIELASQTVPDQTTIGFEISGDKMTATAHLEVKPGCRYELQDMPPEQKITVNAKPVQSLREPLSEESLREKIRDANIAYGIRQESLEKLLTAESSCRVILAEGRPGKDPIDDQLTILYEKEKTFDENQLRVDFREQSDVVCVKEGDVLAEVMPGREGESKIDVTGKETKARPPQKIKLKAGKGVKQSDDGLRYLATIEGQPVLKNQSLQVLSIYQVKQVNMSTGNIHFNGSVFVNNNIEENMLVEAKDEVTVLGSVNMAQIKSGKNIKVQHSVIGSRLLAGGVAATHQTILGHLNDLAPVLEQIEKNLAVAMKTYQDKGLGDKVNEGQLMKLLIEKMFPQLDAQIAQLVQYAFDSKRQVDGKIKDLLTSLKNSLTGVGPVSLSLSDLQVLQAETQGMMQTLQASVENAADITLGYAQNSSVETSGNIVITGKGSYNTNLSAGRDVKITGGPGVFRGGHILAGRNVDVGEIGSPAEVATVVSVSRAGRIKARIVYPNVTIKVGSFSEKIREKKGGYEAKLGPGGLSVSGYPLS